jgi:hypothetical protein
MAGPGDAAALLRLKQQLDLETSFMLLEPGERETSVAMLASVSATPVSWWCPRCHWRPANTAVTCRPPGAPPPAAAFTLLRPGRPMKALLVQSGVTQTHFHTASGPKPRALEV